MRDSNSISHPNYRHKKSVRSPWTAFRTLFSLNQRLKNVNMEIISMFSKKFKISVFKRFSCPSKVRTRVSLVFSPDQGIRSVHEGTFSPISSHPSYALNAKGDSSLSLA